MEGDVIKRYRNEWKYICDEGELACLDKRLAAVLEKDRYSEEKGSYEIHSLYFDDYQDTCARENEAGVASRFKYRIRYYGTHLDTLHLECKEKLNGRCHKESCPLTPEMYEAIIEGRTEELFWATDLLLLRRFCVDCMTRLFRPKVIIDYERVAYVEPVSNVRITLDQYISAAAGIDSFLTGGYLRYPVLDRGFHVLEAKFDHILPGYIRNMISDGKLVQTAFSKYYIGRSKLKSMGRGIL